MIALGTVCLAASATTDRYPVLRRVSALTREGENAVAHCDRVQALSDFRKAERLEPAGYRAHLQLSSIYSALGRNDQDSIIEFLKSLQILPAGAKSLCVDQDGKDVDCPPRIQP